MNLDRNGLLAFLTSVRLLLRGRSSRLWIDLPKGFQRGRNSREEGVSGGVLAQFLEFGVDRRLI